MFIFKKGEWASQSEAVLAGLAGSMGMRVVCAGCQGGLFYRILDVPFTLRNSIASPCTKAESSGCHGNSQSKEAVTYIITEKNSTLSVSSQPLLPRSGEATSIT